MRSSSAGGCDSIAERENKMAVLEIRNMQVSSLLILPTILRICISGSTIYRIGNYVLLTTVLWRRALSICIPNSRKEQRRTPGPWLFDRICWVRSSADASKKGPKVEYCGGAKQGGENPISLQQKTAWSASSFRISIRSYAPHHMSCAPPEVTVAYTSSKVMCCHYCVRVPYLWAGDTDRESLVPKLSSN